MGDSFNDGLVADDEYSNCFELEFGPEAQHEQIW